jgi:hypothetical protein
MKYKKNITKKHKHKKRHFRKSNKSNKIIKNGKNHTRKNMYGGMKLKKPH